MSRYIYICIYVYIYLSLYLSLFDAAPFDTTGSLLAPDIMEQKDAPSLENEWGMGM